MDKEYYGLYIFEWVMYGLCALSILTCVGAGLYYSYKNTTCNDYCIEHNYDNGIYDRSRKGACKCSSITYEKEPE